MSVLVSWGGGEAILLSRLVINIKEDKRRKARGMIETA
jgi:hypothetical protein